MRSRKLVGLNGGRGTRGAGGSSGEGCLSRDEGIGGVKHSPVKSGDMGRAQP